MIKMESSVFKGIIEEYYQNESFSDIVSSEVSSATGAGDNFTSVVKRWKLKICLKSKRVVEKSFIMKSKPDNKILRKFMEYFSLMETEINVYENVFPKVELLMEEYGDKRNLAWCKMIGYIGTEQLILEDLGAENFKMIKNISNLDYEHVMQVMYSLGTLHAMSKIIIEKGLISKENLPSCKLFGDEKAVIMIIEGGVRMCESEMRNSWGKEWLKVADKLKISIPTIKSRLTNLLKSREEKFDVLNHGDLWACNVMYKYHDYKNTPICAKFVDFQFSYYNSLAWDLIFFLYSSVTTTVRRLHLMEFINGYSAALSETLEFYNYQGERPTLQCIKDEMDRLDFVALLMLCSLYASSLSATFEPLFTMKDIDDVEEHLLNCYNPLLFKMDKYKNDVSEDINSFINSGII